MPDVPAGAAETTYRETRAILKAAGILASVLLHGEGRSAWAMVAPAVVDGLDTRIGLEDILHLPDGGTASDNAALVAAARRLTAPR